MEEAVFVETTGAGLFQARVSTPSSTFLVDEPVEVGGLNSGPTPYDLLSMALGACTVMTIRLYAQRKGWSLDGVRVRITHNRRGPNGRDVFSCEIEIVGSLDQEQLDRLLDASKRCPVHKTLEGGADIETAVGTNLESHIAESHCAHEKDCEEVVAAAS